MKYDYRCPSCDRVHEIDKKITLSSRKEFCPDCKVAMKKLPPIGTGFVLKGKGWFKTGGY